MQPTLRWAEREEIHRYRLQLARDDGEAELILDDANVAEGTLAVPQPLPPGKYSWRVAAIDEHGPGPFGDRQRFRRPPPGPLLDTPEIREEEVTLRWRAGLPRQSFHVQLAASAEFQPLLVDARTSDPHITIARPESGTYFVRVKIIDVDGFEGPFEAPQRIDIPAQPVPWWPLLIPLLPLLAL